MKKLVLTLTLLFLLLAGCASAFEGDYEVVTDHVEEGGDSVDDSAVREVAGFAELSSALKGFIDSAAEYGVIRAVDYSGSLEDDFSRACRDVTRDYPMGVYAVDYISHKITPILSYYEIEVYITYKLSREEISAVVDVNSSYDFYETLNVALYDFSGGMTVHIANLSINADGINDYVQQYYRDNPELIMELPKVSVVFYPSPPENYLEKIITVELSYDNSAEILRERRAALKKKSDELFEEIGGRDGAAEAALECARSLGRAASYARSGDTAYHALAEGSANSEGYAMAYKLLCKRCGLDCAVVEGKKNGEPYYWNIIGVGGDYYHVDACSCDRYGLETGFLKKDSEMWGTYWWDIEQYEECSGDLSYERVVAAPESEETGG